MSFLLTAKLRDSVVLATDSRITNGPDEIISDAEVKIQEIAPNIFCGTSGYQYLCNWTAVKAGELAAALGTADVLTIGRALAEALIPALQVLLEDLRAAGAKERVRGDSPLHGFALIGCANGIPNFVGDIFWSSHGQIQGRSVSGGSGESLQAWGTTGRVLKNGIGDPVFWADGLELGIERVFAEVVQRNPRAGGPLQAVLLDNSGTRWLHRLPTSDDSHASPLCSDITCPEITVADITWDEGYGGTLGVDQLVVGAGGAKISHSLIESLDVSQLTVTGDLDMGSGYFYMRNGNGSGYVKLFPDNYGNNSIETNGSILASGSVRANSGFSCNGHGGYGASDNSTTLDISTPGGGTVRLTIAGGLITSKTVIG